MPLEPIVESLESVAEEHRSLYVEATGADGSTYHKLDVATKDGWELSKTSGLVSALEKERKARKDANAALQAESRAATEKVATLEAEIDRIKNHKSKESVDSKEELRVLKEQLQVEKTKASDLQSAYANSMKADQGRAALEQAGFKAKADVMLPHIEKDIATEEIDGKLVAVVMGPDGHRMVAGEDGNPRLMTPLDRALELAGDPRFADLKDGSGSSGGGTTGGAHTPASTIAGVRTIPASRMMNPTAKEAADVAAGRLVVVEG